MPLLQLQQWVVVSRIQCLKGKYPSNTLVDTCGPWGPRTQLLGTDKPERRQQQLWQRRSSGCGWSSKQHWRWTLRRHQDASSTFGGESWEPPKLCTAVMGPWYFDWRSNPATSIQQLPNCSIFHCSRAGGWLGIGIEVRSPRYLNVYLVAKARGFKIQDNFMNWWNPHRNAKGSECGWAVLVDTFL